MVVRSLPTTRGVVSDTLGRRREDFNLNGSRSMEWTQKRLTVFFQFIEGGVCAFVFKALIYWRLVKCLIVFIKLRFLEVRLTLSFRRSRFCFWTYSVQRDFRHSDSSQFSTFLFVPFGKDFLRKVCIVTGGIEWEDPVYERPIIRDWKFLRKEFHVGYQTIILMIRYIS